jgi:hypothetical protein
MAIAASLLVAALRSSKFRSAQGKERGAAAGFLGLAISVRIGTFRLYRAAAVLRMLSPGETWREKKHGHHHPPRDREVSEVRLS